LRVNAFLGDEAADAAKADLAQALSGLDRLNSAAIQELQAHRVPPEAVAIVMSVVCVLLGVEPTWVEAKKLLSCKTQPLLASITSLDTDNVPQKVLKTAKKGISAWPEVEVFRRSSIAAYALACWVKALLAYAQLRH
jgi:hypothetical protein